MPAAPHLSPLLGAAFDDEIHAQLVVDAEGTLVIANRHACHFFQIIPSDVGRPFRDLALSYRPMELRGPIEDALRTGQLVRLTDVELTHASDGVQQLEVEICPLLRDRTVLGASLTFIDMSQKRQLQGQLERTKQELEIGYEELQATNEELETSNEELQSTVEEVQTTNEELQSVNHELDIRTEELERATAFHETVLSGLPAGVMVLDESLRVLIWNRQRRSSGAFGRMKSEDGPSPVWILAFPSTG